MKETIEWISVEDRLPEKSDRLLVRSEHGIQTSSFVSGIQASSFVSGQWWSRCQKLEAVTHWAELPKGPEVEQ